MTKVGCKPSVARKLHIDYVLDDENSPIELTIPDDVTVSLKSFSLATLIAESTYNDVDLLVKGTLLVNSMDELANLRYLDKKQHNHRIVFNTYVTG